MAWTPPRILELLDRCGEAFFFPALDNGYIYAAASRLTLFGSATDWALTIEVFGFSPRVGVPGVDVYTFASRFASPPPSFVSDAALRGFLAEHPHDRHGFVEPLENTMAWRHPDSDEHVDLDAGPLLLRGAEVPMPAADDYVRHGIELEAPPQVAVFELCRALAATRREAILATDDELREHVVPDLEPIGRLDDWAHPDLVSSQRVSSSETFQQLAEILCGRDVSSYRRPTEPNTHWRFWPDGGTL